MGVSKVTMKFVYLFIGFIYLEEFRRFGIYCLRRSSGGNWFLFFVSGYDFLCRLRAFYVTAFFGFSGVTFGTAFRRTRVVYFFVSYVIGITLSPKTLLYWIRSLWRGFLRDLWWPCHCMCQMIVLHVHVIAIVIWDSAHLNVWYSYAPSGEALIYGRCFEH